MVKLTLIPGLLSLSKILYPPVWGGSRSDKLTATNQIFSVLDGNSKFIDARGDAGFVQWMATASMKGVLGERRIGLHQGDQWCLFSQPPPAVSPPAF